MKNKLDNLREAFFEEADLFMTIWDKDLKCIDISQSTLNALQLTRKEVIGRPMTEISPDVESTGRLALCKEVLRTGETLIADEKRTHQGIGNIYIFG